VGIGLLSVGAEAGRPLRGFNVLRNVWRSWMSRESAFALALIALSGLNTLLWASPLLQAVAVVCGAGLVFSQGMILSNAKGIPAWNVSLMPWMFLSSALISGAGAILLLTAVLPGAGAHTRLVAAAAAMLILLDAALWERYLNLHGASRTFHLSLAVLRSGFYRWANLGLGHAVPLVMLVWSMWQSATWALPLSGAAILVGGWLTKRGLVQEAALVVDLFEGFGTAAGQVARAPASGAGRRAAA
jgi:DMSO reductase anchor subunit